MAATLPSLPAAFTFPIQHLLTALGLSASAGLNAYIPLLLLGITQHLGYAGLKAPYDQLGSWWAITILAVLCLFELVVDKIPGADHINDIIQTFIRPTAGAFLFASQTGMITWIHPSVFVVIGLITAGTVHATKAVARAPLNAATFGIAAPIMSSAENLSAIFLCLVAIIAPLLVLFVMAILIFVLYRMIRRFRRAGDRLQPMTRLVMVPPVQPAQPSLPGA